MPYIQYWYVFLLHIRLMVALRFTIYSLITLSLLHVAAVAQQYRFDIYEGNQRCGTAELSVLRLENGYLEYHLRETRSLIDIDGSNRDHTFFATCLSDANLAPIKVETRTTFRNRTTVVRGSTVDGFMHLERDLGEGKVDRWREDCVGAVVDIMLPELLLRSSTISPRRVFRVRDLLSLAQSIRIEGRGSDSARITLDGNEYWLATSDGVLLSYGIPALGRAWHPARRGVVETCVYSGAVFWDAGTFALDIRPDNLASMTATLKLRGHVGVTLIPEDARQQIDRNAALTENAVTVKTRKRFLRPRSATIPVFTRDMLPYIRGDDFVTLDATSIRTLAATQRTWENRASVVSASLTTLVQRRFIEDQFVPLLPAAAIAEVPRGTSIHATLLLVTLARSVGLPARFVFGLVPENGRWRSDVWAELWSGSWLPYSPLSGGLLTDAGRITLLHTPSLEAVLEQSRRLNGNLTVVIDAFEMIDSGPGGELHTGIIASTYSNREYRCTIAAPDEDWLLEERKLTDEIIVLMTPSIGSPISFELRLLRNPQRLSSMKLLENRIKALQAVMESVTVEERGEIRIDQYRAPYVLYSATERLSSGEYAGITSAHCMLVVGDRGYLLTFKTPEGQFDEARPELQYVLRNFRVYPLLK